MEVKQSFDNILQMKQLFYQQLPKFHLSSKTTSYRCNCCK